MADRDRPSHDIDDVGIDLPPLRGPPLEVREHLRGERFMDLDQSEVRPLDSGALERRRDGENRRLEQLPAGIDRRSEEHTSELQSRLHLVCRLLLEKKKKKHV